MVFFMWCGLILIIILQIVKDMALSDTINLLLACMNKEKFKFSSSLMKLSELEAAEELAQFCRVSEKRREERRKRTVTLL